MKYFIYLLFLIQIQNCKSETCLKPKIPSIKNVIVNKSTGDNYSIDSIERISIGKQIEELNKIKLLKITLKNSFERQIDKPYMWDIFIPSNESLLQFYDYKIFMINGTNFKSYYIKINYEDANFQCILLVNEDLDTEYNSMIV